MTTLMPGSSEAVRHRIDPAHRCPFRTKRQHWAISARGS
jgi:hypothetical protein